MDGDGVERARAALARGDVLMAYDEASAELVSRPDDHGARFIAALALARAGAAEGALVGASELADRIAADADAPASLREDVAALLARLAKDDALGRVGDDRRTGLVTAAGMYERVADAHGGYHACINAATLRCLAGERDRAVELARRALRDARDAVNVRPEDTYWRAVTVAEASLVLGDTDATRAALVEAVAGRPDPASMAVTRRQLRMLCEATAVDPEVLAVLHPPIVLHYCGHREDDTTDRFTSAMEVDVVTRVDEHIAAHRVDSGYGSLASGADIVIAESLLRAGAQLHVVIPFDVDEFERVSVTPAGRRWSARFRACLGHASSVVQVSDSCLPADDLFGFAARIAMGHALNRAKVLDAPAAQLAVWDGREGPDVAGTAHDVTVWRATGHPTHVVPLRTARYENPVPTPEPQLVIEIGVILFADFREFSRLRTEQFPAFIDVVFSALGAVMDTLRDKVRWRNTWGDAVAAVFADVTAAAECALAFHETIRSTDLEVSGLPADLDLRISGHAGAVLVQEDPITRRSNYWGRELTRAARIEPRTPAGEVYVTDAFAALLALETESGFATDYVGRITTAKDFETIPMYRLRRAPSRRHRPA